MKSRKESGAAVGWIIVVIIALCIIGFLIWWFGFRNTSNNTSSNTNTKTSQPSDQEQMADIRTNWAAFFSGQTPADKKVSLLQNGQNYKQVIDQQSQSKTAQATSVTVSNVQLQDSSKATVTYTIDINGQPALKNQAGVAVKENGVWKVSDAAFCSLLQLSGTVPPNCPGGSGSTSGSGSTQTPTAGTKPSGH